MSIDKQSSDEALVQWLSDVVASIDDIYLRKPLVNAAQSDRLTEDLGIDSLGRVNLLYGIIDTLGKDVPETEAETWAVLGDVLGFIRQLLD